MQRTIHVIRQLLLAALLFPAVAFGQARENPEKVTLQLQWKHQFEFAGFYAAKEKGYYAEAGLEVEIREYEQGGDIIASVLSDEASFGTLYSSPIRARMEGKPVILAANYFKRSPLAFVVRPDIYFPGDLKGKRVMGEKHELESANFAQMFRQFDMTTADFVIVPHTFSIDKFINHEVDAMTVFLTNEVFHLQQKKVPSLKVIKSFHQPPFVIHEGDSVTGYLHDLLWETLNIAGLKAQYVSGGDTYDEMVAAIRKGEAHLLPNMNSTRELSDQVARTAPVVTTPNALVGKITAPKIKTVSDLFGAKVAVVQGYAQDQQLNSFPQIQKVHVSNNDEGFEAVRRGKADYFLNNLANASYIIQKIFATDLRVCSELPYDVFRPLSLSFAVSRRYPELETIIQKSLAVIPMDARIRLRKKWLDIEKTFTGYEQGKIGFFLSDEERSYLSEKGPIRMCPASGWLPVEWIDAHGRHQGISAEFMNLIAQRIGLEFELIPADTWNEMTENLKSGTCDFVPTAIKMPDRGEYLNFTESYQELDVVIATRKEQIYIQNLDTLVGQKIGVVKDSVYQTLIEKNHPTLEIVPVEDIYQGLHQVQDGVLIGLVDNLISLAFAIQQEGLVDIKISGRAGDPIQLCMGIHKDQPMLHQILSRALGSIPQQQRQEFASKWIAVKFEQGIDYTLLWKVVAATACIIVGICLWNRKLAAFNQKILKAKKELEQSNLVAEKAKAAAEKADRAKSRFLANMSHELRTPLNAILGFSELMKQDSGITPALLSHLETINRSGEHLLSLINDVLELSKIEAGRVVLNPETFDLHRHLAILEEMLRLRAREKSLAMVFDCGAEVPRYIRADQSKLRQILINLLGNAVKFTESGEVVLQVTKVEPEGKDASEKCFLRFEVRDTGPGIVNEDREKIFDAFFQAEKRPLSSQGTGLGLPISRKFVELMGGKLAVASKVGMGTCFSFQLSIPCAKEEEAAFSNVTTRRVAALEAGQPVHRLLVAEDNQNNRNLMITLLKNAGFEVQEAVNGKQAVEIWNTWKPNLIWMDMRMPVMDGYEAIQLIKSSPEGDTVVIVGLTASAFEEDRIRVIQHGADDFVRKPFKASDIFDVIQRHLGVRYVYASEAPDAAPATSKETCSTDRPLAELMASMPADIVRRLKEATELSDAAMIDGVIEEIRVDHEPLAQRLAVLADHFAYDKILSLVELNEMKDAGNA